MSPKKARSTTKNTESTSELIEDRGKLMALVDRAQGGVDDQELCIMIFGKFTDFTHLALSEKAGRHNHELVSPAINTQRSGAQHPPDHQIIALHRQKIA